MNRNEAELMAWTMIVENDLLGWTFDWDRAKNRLGQCNFSKKTITLSKFFVDSARREEVEQTMFHEIAHALLPTNIGHSELWRIQARILGYTGARTSAWGTENQQVHVFDFAPSN